MAGLKDTLPPANALVVFEAAARHLNFTRASRELKIAQPAVTRQIRNLEADLQIRLFHRNNNQLTLTAEGEQMQQVVSEALQRISALSEIFRNTGTEKLLIGSTFAFANLWLVPRLPALRKALDGAHLNLLISEDYEDFSTSNPDFSIRFGRGHWPGMMAHRLFAEEVYPVATAELVETHDLHSAETWQTVTLLDQPTDARHEPWMTWSEWRKRSPAPDLSTCNVTAFDNYLYVLDAACNGEGVALGMTGLTDAFEAQHGLVRIGSRSVTSQAGYYLVYPEWYPRPRTITALLSILKEGGP
ncbi:LysR family transcriptional regulator [Coralliovum pocilloporae]|uniref:LysR family transcriptional regulator n=1 Tax=Coralliovum pocilloporae TaxID=3066369 RepID=UPI0033074730